MPLNRIGINVQNTYKSFRTTKALNGISTEFTPGKMHGVIGPEGAGKTTLMRLIMGLMKPDQGAVEFSADGTKTDFEIVRPSLAYMPQQQSLYADLSIKEHLLFFKSMYALNDEEYCARSQTLLELTRLTPFIDRPAGKLSGGMYKKLGLMCALLYSPQVLILDEPTNGVDPVSRRELWELLYGFMSQQMLIIVSTSYMDEAERCTHVHLLDEGKLVAHGEPQTLLQQYRVKNFDELFLQNEGKLTHVR